MVENVINVVQSEYDEEDKVLSILDKWIAEEYERPDGTVEPLFDEEILLARLLISEHVYLNSRHWKEEDKDHVYVGALCNDVFFWACGDATELPYNQIRPLYNMIIKDPSWGATKWAILQRNMYPQKPIYEAMVKKGSWDEELQNADLKPNPSWPKLKDET